MPLRVEGQKEIMNYRNYGHVIPISTPSVLVPQLPHRQRLKLRSSLQPSPRLRLEVALAAFPFAPSPSPSRSRRSWSTSHPTCLSPYNAGVPPTRSRDRGRSGPALRVESEKRVAQGDLRIPRSPLGSTDEVQRRRLLHRTL